MSDIKPKEFEDYKDTMPIEDVYVLAKYGFNTRKALKDFGINPDHFMEMIQCNIKKP